MKKQTFTWSDAIEEVIRQNDNVATLKLMHQMAPYIYAQNNQIKEITPPKTISQKAQP